MADTPLTDFPAYHTLAPTSDVPLFVFGDHASRFIPTPLADLGLSGDDLTRHIAWDIGTEAVIRGLATHFGCGAHICAVSRLVIDMNRDPAAPGLIPVQSDGTLISGNEVLSKADRRARIAAFYDPYHDGLARAMQDMPHNPLIISVHSFTPHPKTGALRDTDIGLLVKHDTDTADRFVSAMKDCAPDWQVDINLPYSAYDLNYTVDRHIGADGPRHLAIEMRQDHVQSQDTIERMTARLISALSALL